MHGQLITEATVGLVSATGQQSGLVQSLQDITVSGPDYLLIFAVTGHVSVANGASGNASDPDVFLTLPPGWTYTLEAVDPTDLVNPVPEPTTLALVGTGLFGLAVAASRRCRRLYLS